MSIEATERFVQWGLNNSQIFKGAYTASGGYLINFQRNEPDKQGRDAWVWLVDIDEAHDIWLFMSVIQSNGLKFESGEVDLLSLLFLTESVGYVLLPNVEGLAPENVAKTARTVKWGKPDSGLFLSSMDELEVCGDRS